MISQSFAAARPLKRKILGTKMQSTFRLTRVNELSATVGTKENPTNLLLSETSTAPSSRSLSEEF